MSENMDESNENIMRENILAHGEENQRPAGKESKDPSTFTPL